MHACVAWCVCRQVVAWKNGHHAVVRRLLEAGADPTVVWWMYGERREEGQDKKMDKCHALVRVSGGLGGGAAVRDRVWPWAVGLGSEPIGCCVVDKTFAEVIGQVYRSIEHVAFVVVTARLGAAQYPPPAT